MKTFCASFHQTLLLSFMCIYLAGLTTVSSISPQHYTEKSKDNLDIQLPPKEFPKGIPTGSIHVGEEPPIIFPDYKSLESSAISTTTVTSKPAAKNRDIEQDDTTSKSNKTSNKDKIGKEASEVSDLLKPTMNITVYEDGTETPLNNETETVTGPHVVNETKTHVEDTTKSSVDKQNNTMKNKNVANESAPNDTVKNETVKQNSKNEKKDSVTASPSATTTNDGKEVSSETTTLHEDAANTTTDAGNITTTEELEHNENQTAVTEAKQVENVTDTMQTNTSIPVTASSTTSPDSKNVSTGKTNSDNKTVQDKSSTSSVSPPVSTKSTEKAKETTTATVPPTLKVESTTSVNISENIIDHKAEPMALAAAQQHGEHSHASSGKSSAFLQPTESAAILAGVFVGIALLGYVGLLVWRRVLERRYGNREMLVNEDDFYDTNDLRNFEL